MESDRKVFWRPFVYHERRYPGIGHAILAFANYLLKLIDQSKLRFNEADFIKRVLDPCYVKTAEFSTLLVQEIPKRQRANANIEIQIILRRNEGDIYALHYLLCYGIMYRIQKRFI